MKDILYYTYYILFSNNTLSLLDYRQ